MVSARYLSPTNTHLPVATGIVVGYVRDPKEFALNRYCQLVETKSVNGLYYTLDPDHPARIIKRSEFVWQPGADAPQGHTNLGTFKSDDFVCERLAFPFTVGDTPVEQAKEFAGWDPLTYEAKAMAQQAMTLRTNDVWSSNGDLYLDNSANWPAYNTASAATLSGVGGGSWKNATSANQVIKKSLWNAVRRINQVTNGVVKPEDLVCVISPQDAIDIASADEIVDFVKQQASAPSLVQDPWGNPNELWLLPPRLYGIKLLVENTSYVNTLPIEGGFSVTAGTRAYAKGNGNAVLLARPGGISAPFGAKSFCTLQCMWMGYDMAVETLHDPWNKLHRGRVVDYRKFITPALSSGFNITGVTDNT